MAVSFLSGFIEVFQQPDKPTICGRHGPRSLLSYVASQQEARKNRRCWPLVAFFSISEFVGHQAGCGNPQYNEGDLTVSLATARYVEV